MSEGNGTLNEVLDAAPLSLESRKRVLRAAIFTPMKADKWCPPIIAWGPPGGAKTAIAHETAIECGLPCKVLSPGRSGDGAFGVTPVPYEGPDGRVRIGYPPPEWVDLFVDGRGLLFCDEMTAGADDSIQAAMLGMLSEREVGGTELPGGVRPIGASNPPDVAAGGRELAFPVLNRAGHLRWPKLTDDEHAEYMLRGGMGREVAQLLDPAEEEKRVLAAWPDAYAVAAGLETNYLRRNRGKKNGEWKPGMLQVATDRTWEFATRAYASSIVHRLSNEETEAFVAAYIGTAAMLEWFEFIERQDLPDPAKLLDGDGKWSHDPNRIDRTAVVLDSCAVLVTPPNAHRRAERSDALWTLLTREFGAEDARDRDAAIPCVAALVAAKLHNTPKATALFTSILPLMQAAGLVRSVE